MSGGRLRPGAGPAHGLRGGDVRRRAALLRSRVEVGEGGAEADADRRLGDEDRDRQPVALARGGRRVALLVLFDVGRRWRLLGPGPGGAPAAARHRPSAKAIHGAGRRRGRRTRWRANGLLSTMPMVRHRGRSVADAPVEQLLQPRRIAGTEDSVGALASCVRTSDVVDRLCGRLGARPRRGSEANRTNIDRADSKGEYVMDTPLDDRDNVGNECQGCGATGCGARQSAPEASDAPGGLSRRELGRVVAAASAGALLAGGTPSAWAQQEAPATGMSPDLDVVKKSKGPVMTTVDEFYKVGPGPLELTHHRADADHLRLLPALHQAAEGPARQGDGAQGPPVRQPERDRQGTRHRARRARRHRRQGAGDGRPAVPRQPRGTSRTRCSR